MKKYNVTVNGKKYEVEIEEVGGAVNSAVVTGSAQSVSTPAPAVAEPINNPSATVHSEGEAVNSPMPGTILNIKVTAGQKVSKGDVLCILEAMKMENDIVSPKDGTVASVNTQKGASVNSGDLLFTIA